MHRLNLDGWGLRWSTGSTTTTKRAFYSVNLRSIPPQLFLVTSTNNSNSLSFMFVSRINNLEITKTSSFDYDSMYITTFVTIKNLGDSPISDLYCKSRFYLINNIIILSLYRF